MEAQKKVRVKNIGDVIYVANQPLLFNGEAVYLDAVDEEIRLSGTKKPRTTEDIITETTGTNSYTVPSVTGAFHVIHLTVTDPEAYLEYFSEKIILPLGENYLFIGEHPYFNYEKKIYHAGTFDLSVFEFKNIKQPWCAYQKIGDNYYRIDTCFSKLRSDELVPADCRLFPVIYPPENREQVVRLIKREVVQHKKHIELLIKVGLFEPWDGIAF